MERIEVRADCVEHRRSGTEYCIEWKSEKTKGDGKMELMKGAGREGKKEEERGEDEVGIMLHDWHSFLHLRFSHRAGRQAGTRVA